MESYLRISTWTFSLHFSSAVRKKQVHFPSCFIAWLGFPPFAFAYMQESESENGVIRYCRPYSSASSSTFLRGAINHIENTLFSNLPSLSSSLSALSHYNLSLLQTSKYNHHHLRCAIKTTQKTPSFPTSILIIILTCIISWLSFPYSNLKIQPPLSLLIT